MESRVEKKIERIAEELESLNNHFSKIIKLMEKQIDIIERMPSEREQRLNDAIDKIISTFFSKIK